MLLSIITLLVPTTFAKKTSNAQKVDKKNHIVQTVAEQTPIVQTVAKKTPIVQQVTGGGWILGDCGGEYKKTFGFNAEELEDGTFRGNVEYVDHDINYRTAEGKQLNVHGYEITGLVIDGNKAEIWGACRLNGDNTRRDFYVQVLDRDEPGKHDYFSIEIPSLGYWRGAELGFPYEAGGGGNIQVHRPEM